MPRLRMAMPVWLEAAREPRARMYPTVGKSLRVDVAIVGGGITGAALAFCFAEAGVRVAVLEAARIGRGSTAASTALLMQEPDTDFVELSARYGQVHARRIWRLSRQATEELIASLDELGIACDLERRDSVYYAAQSTAARRLRREYRRRRAARIGARWLNAAALARATGVRGAGGIRTHGNAQADPYRACLGLMAAARRRGARIFEQAEVERIDTEACGVRLAVNGAEVRAREVVIATGYATPYFKPLHARFRMLNTYVVATKPLSGSRRRALGLRDVMLWDAARPYHYARWTAEGRLLLGGGDRPRVDERHRRRALEDGAARVWRHFARVYPMLSRADIDFAWEGLFATTPDGLPYIGPHESYPHHLFALGYGGNGMTFGFLAARLLVDWYRGRRSRDHALFSFDR